MKKTINIIILLLISSFIYGQSNYAKIKSVELITPRKLYLNGGLRSQVGGKSRTYIEINLPPHTVKWYYSFTTSKGQSGYKNLNLALQLSTLLVNPSLSIANLRSHIKVPPEGTSLVDVYLCDQSNVIQFLNKVDNSGGAFSYIMQGSTFNTRQALVEVDDVKSGRWFLGIKNPSSLNAVKVTIEVVALVKE